jgi:N-methylhydantoinase A
LGPADPSAALVGVRDVYFEDGYLKSKVYDRRRLKPGAEVVGPAIVEQMDSTTVVPPNLTAAVDGLRNLRVKVGMEGEG